MTLRMALAMVLCASPALSQQSMTAEEFDALTRGRTMTWSEFGQVYGIEQYLPDHKVRWTAVGNDCKTGHWYAQGAMICFLYEDDVAPDCWTITRSGTDFLARYATGPADADPVVVTETTEPLACFGPEVGA